MSQNKDEPNKNQSPQSKRLKQFVEITGYTVAEFTRQCQIASPRTMTKILSDGNAPTPKVLDKIITRFPQLNHDWVVLGYGEMIVKGLQTQETSVNSLEKSSESSYQYIIQALRDHDFALNETSKAIEKANEKVDMTAKLTVDTVNAYRQEQKERATEFFEKNDLRSTAQEKYVTLELEGIRNEAKRIEIENRALIERLDKERRIRSQENFDKLSRKIHGYLKESREMQHGYLKESREMQKDLIREEVKLGMEKGNNYLAESRDLQEKLIIKINEEALKKLIEQMNDNAVKQTDIAIKALLDKFSLKKILPGLGSPDKVSNPKHQK